MVLLLGGGKVQSRGKTYDSYSAYQSAKSGTTTTSSSSKSTPTTTTTKSSGGTSSIPASYTGATPSAALLEVAKQAGITAKSLVTPHTGGGSLDIDYLNKLLAARGNTAANTTSITTDSTSAVNAENALNADIQSLLKRSGLSGDVNDYVDPLYNLRDDQLAQIQAERDSLARRRADEVAGIEAGYQVAQTELGEVQKKETGSTSMALATAGGYLGVTASQMGVLQNLAQAQRQELFALQAQKDDALRQANNAYEDRDFDLVREKLAAARDIEKQVFDRRNTFLTQQLDILGEIRSQAQEQRLSQQFKRDMANERIDRLITAGVTPSSNDILAIAREIGMSPDETKKMFDAAEASRKLEEKAARTNQDVAVINALRGVPRDKIVVIDGVSYRGLAELDQTANAAQAALTATERLKQAKDDERAMLMDDLRGGVTQDGTRIEPISLDEAIKSYPNLETKEIKEIFEALKEYESNTKVQNNLASGKWGIEVPYSESGTAQPAVIYDKEKYKAALEAWEKETAGAWFGEIKGSDDAIARVHFEGKTYVGRGTKGKDGYYSPISIYDYRVPETTLNK